MPSSASVAGARPVTFQSTKDIAVDEYAAAYNNDDDLDSEYCSVMSAITRGVIENGRRYQALKEGTYYAPADEQQFQSMEVCHALYSVLHCQEPEPLFFAPLQQSPTHVLDIGTGKGNWAIDVADKYPQAVVHGLDLYPPPNRWVPPNVQLEVDDVLQPWTFANKFSLIHLRHMHGSFQTHEWRTIYAKSFDALAPGGWIEQVETSITIDSSDGSVTPSSALASWGPTMIKSARNSLHPLDTIDTMAASIQSAGFVNLHERSWQLPIGSWPKNKYMKEVGKLNKIHWQQGLEGWVMWFLTRYGDPKPWTAAEVKVFTAKVQAELRDKKIHAFHRMKRVWAQKPLN